MKISLNWLKQYINLEETVETVSETLTNCGLEVSHIANNLSINTNLKELLIGEVVECEQHPNADRLKLLKVNLGENDVRQIVCGAPNVDFSQKVIVAPIGAILCDDLGNKITIKSSKIRGIVSEGMICSAAEIGLGKNSDGIVVLDTSLPNGTRFEESLPKETDVIFDIELTPNRGDACSHLGVARDLSAALDLDLQYPQISENLNVTNAPLPLEVEISPNIGCHRYTGVVMKNIKIEDSPEWLRDRLKSIGLTPKNNLLDIATYVMYELGQPLHIYDYDLINNKTIIISNAIKNEEITTLDGKQRIVKFRELSIADGLGPICIPGVMGGDRTAVNDSTKNIFIESAFFDQAIIRKISKSHALSTDASFRFERGTGNNTFFALKRVVYLIQKLATGIISSKIFDVIEKDLKESKVILFTKNLEKISGIKIPLVEIKRILKRLEIIIDSEKPDSLHLSIPLFKADVTREIDVIEEIMRIYGYAKINANPVLNSSYLSPKSDCEEPILNLDVSKFLIGRGFFEIRTNPIVESKNNAFLGLSDENEIIKLLNPLSHVMDSMRKNLVFSGLEVIAHNINRQQTDLKIFEFGKTYDHLNNKNLENNKLSLWITGNYNFSNLTNSKKEFDFQDLKAYVYDIFKTVGIVDIDIHEASNSLFERCITLSKNKIDIAVLGQLKTKLLKNFDIGQKVFFSDINWDTVININAKNKTTYKLLSKYPAIERDISLLLDEKITFLQIKNLILSKENKAIEEIQLLDIYIGSDLPVETKSYLIRIIIQPYDKTLESAEVSKLMQDIENILIQNLNIKIRG